MSNGGQSVHCTVLSFLGGFRLVDPNCSITCSSVSSTSSPPFPTINTWPGQKSTHSFNSEISLLFHHILFLSQQQICFCCPDVYFALSAMQLDARFKCLLFLSRTEQTGVVRAMDGPKFS